MPYEEITAAVKEMQKHRRNLPDYWLNSNGTWSHHKDAKREWRDKIGCLTDLRFTNEHER